MGYLPICLQLEDRFAEGRRCLVVGGGEVARQKVEVLRAAGIRNAGGTLLTRDLPRGWLARRLLGNV